MTAKQPQPAVAPSARAAWIALALLTMLNLLNYTDRYVLAGVQPLVQRAFHVNDERVGALTFAFFITYMFAAPLTGWLGDHFPRKPLIIIGALLWSLLTLSTALVHTFNELYWRHALVGIGEASFCIYAPALLSDYWPAEQRNKILTIFYLSLPVGAAIGYILGGTLGQAYGWRTPFYISAVPGLLVVLLVWLFMREPARGASEPLAIKPDRATLMGLARNPAYWTATLGMAMMVFTLGGISVWMPTFLYRNGHYSLAGASQILGAITVVDGIVGTWLGGWIAQRWLRRNKAALYLLSAWSMLLAAPFALLMFYGPRPLMVPCLAVAEFMLFLNTGPLNAAIVNAVAAPIRSTAIAIELFVIHALGDAPSPRIIGWVSDHSSLRVGLAITLITLIASAVLIFAGVSFAPKSIPLRFDVLCKDHESRMKTAYWMNMSWLQWILSHGNCLFADVAWLIAGAWLWRILPALKMLPTVPDLCDSKYAAIDLKDWPSITVVVPAKDEARAIESCMRSLLASDYPNLQIIAVNDRSTDATGDLMDRIAADAPAKLRVQHVLELPEGWLGKSHAMALAAEEAKSDWLLFTDADVLFAPDVLRRAVVFATRSKADHFVLYPTLVLQGWTEHMLIAFFQSVSALAGRPWKIPDPRAKRDFIGIGAFNMIRRPVYEVLGGYTALRMEVLEDMRLGYRVKSEGYAQRVAFGKDLIRIRWAESARGMLQNLTKNLFAAFRFRATLVLCACVGMTFLALTPFVALVFSGPARWAGVTTLLALLLLNLRYWRQTNISPVYLLLFPIATLLFLWTLLRSMVLALWRGGVLWRGTLYSLKELRRHAGPLR